MSSAEPVYYICPSGCGCMWRDNREGTMSLFDGEQKSCDVCEILPLANLTLLTEKIKMTSPFLEITSDNIHNIMYLQHGYENRKEYLETLAEDNGLDIDTVNYIADLYGPSEDFDGLVTALEDIGEHYE